MIKKRIAFDLPLPWHNCKFSTERIGHINFLVGPNGSGKSKFAQTLKGSLPHVRLLGTDRLSGMEQRNPLANIFGDRLSAGLAKNHFPHYKQAGEEGGGIDALVLLEERMDLRIQVEATLSHLFERRIILDWDSGHLLPRAILRDTGTSYRLDRDECHGIKELLVLLTHLYNDQYQHLIIDEPELNLHPQFQAFFMQEARKFVSKKAPNGEDRAIFLITHSPFILDFRNVDDLKSVISFRLDHSTPKQLFDLDEAASHRLAGLVPRLNVHHKQLFFSDNPVFVEGILDAQLVGTIQECRGVSMAGAGSCIIDAGGCEEVNRYLELCIALGKKAHFIYDLDSLFGGNLRACIRQDGTIQHFLSAAGVGNDFVTYSGQLDGKLTGLIDRVVAVPAAAVPLDRLVQYLQALGPRSGWDGKRWGKARTALLTTISRFRAELVNLVGEADIADVEGRLRQITTALRQRLVYLLPGGTLERYLPSYTGNPYELADEAKRNAVAAELTFLAMPISDEQLEARYGDLYRVIKALPSKITVDVDKTLRTHLSRYILDLQMAINANKTWDRNQLQAHLAVAQPACAKVFGLRDLVRGQDSRFQIVVTIVSMLDQPERTVAVTQDTNAGMGTFAIS